MYNIWCCVLDSGRTGSGRTRWTIGVSPSKHCMRGHVIIVINIIVVVAGAIALPIVVSSFNVAAPSHTHTQTHTQTHTVAKFMADLFGAYIIIELLRSVSVSDTLLIALHSRQHPSGTLVFPYRPRPKRYSRIPTVEPLRHGRPTPLVRHYYTSCTFSSSVPPIWARFAAAAAAAVGFLRRNVTYVYSRLPNTLMLIPMQFSHENT